MQVVKEIAKCDDIRLMIELIFFSFHGISSIKSLTALKWVGPTRNLAITLQLSAQLDTPIIPFSYKKCQGKNERFGPLQEGGFSSQN